MRAGATSATAMVVVREPTFGSKVTFFVARDHFINLARKPSCISIVQGCACGGNVCDRGGMKLFKPARTEHALP